MPYIDVRMSEKNTPDDVFAEADSDEYEVKNMTGLLSRIDHGHGPNKGRGNNDGYGNHDLRGRFNVTNEFVEKMLFSQPNDHLAVHEMALRYQRGEFDGYSAFIFEDIDETSSEEEIESRWDSIISMKSSATVPPEAKEALEIVLDNRNIAREESEQEMVEMETFAETAATVSV